jgi:hypothetical protein
LCCALRDAYFYWELILLSRKVGVMASFLFFASMTETAWFLGSAIIVSSLLLHCAAKPYEDELIDWCELLSLLSTLFIFQAGLVFKVLNDPENPQVTGVEGDLAQTVKNGLESVSMALTVLNVFLATFCEFRVYMHVRDGEEDYRVRMLKRQKGELEEQLAEFELGIVKAKQLASERAAHRAAMHSGGDEESEFGNPVADDNGSDDEEPVQKAKKRSDDGKKG